MDIYFGGFNNKEDIEEQFEIKIPDDILILFAGYRYENWQGDAYIIFAKDGKLFEVQASHCSCYDLRRQWEPEEITREEIINHRYGVSLDYKEQILKNIDEYMSQNHENP